MMTLVAAVNSVLENELFFRGPTHRLVSFINRRRPGALACLSTRQVSFSKWLPFGSVGRRDQFSHGRIRPLDNSGKRVKMHGSHR